MRKLIMVLGLAAVMVAASVSTTSAQRGGPGGVGGPGAGGPRVGGGPGGERGPGIGRPGGQGRRMFRARIARGLRQLDLTPEQRTKVREVLQKSKAEAAPLAKQLRDQRQSVRAAIQSGTAPEVARAEAKAASESVRTQLRDIAAKTRAEIRGLLTPEQIEKLPTGKK